MAVVQSTYNEYMRRGFPGMIANAETSNRISRIVETAAIPFGAKVYRGSNPELCTSTSGGQFLGFAFATSAATGDALQTATDNYAVGSACGIMTGGVLWITADATATQGAAVTGAAGWVYDTNGASGDLVRIAKR